MLPKRRGAWKENSHSAAGEANGMPFPQAGMNFRMASCFLPPLWRQRMILSEHHFVPTKRERINESI
jgi:hypothetical protein